MTHSASLLLYRRTSKLEGFLGHFGGPYWQNKGEGAWTIPKGLIEEDEAPFDAARRKFEEETGIAPPSDRDAYVDLGAVQQSSSKEVTALSLVDPPHRVVNLRQGRSALPGGSHAKRARVLRLQRSMASRACSSKWNSTLRLHPARRR